jgi:hypothetical protein
MGQKTRYAPLPDQAYDPRVTDLSKPFNVPAATGPQAITSIDPATGLATTQGGWVNRNVTNTIPFQLTAGVSTRALPYNPKRTGLLIQNDDTVNPLNFSFSNDLKGNGVSIGPGGAVLFDFTTPPDTLYLFCGGANIACLVLEISRMGGG